MKKICFRIIIAALVVSAVLGSAKAAELLVPVGQTIGLRLDSTGVTVVDFLADGPCPAKEAGLNVGDVILKADGLELHSAEELQNAVRESTGTVELTVRRKGTLRQMTVEPETPEGRRLGVYVREGISGIGTVTYYDPETGRFGALGHGVNTSEGALVEMENGVAMASTVIEVKKGQVGSPGQLRGAFSAQDQLGTLTANTKCGLFGKSERGWTGEPMPIAEADEIQTGKAEILSNVSGTQVERYQVEILKLYPEDRANGRNILLQVTDAALLEKTGGIVQGMSGSPILQNGKLVGAVTHVLVNDPKTGYGIFIENMLDAAA